MNMKMIIPMVMIAAMPMGADAQNKSGLVMSNLDKTTKPADDFYQFATGGWQKNNPLPAAYSRYGSFDQLQENNNKRINSILGELQKKSYKKGSIEQKLSDFYKLAIDVDRRNKEGIAPVKPLLDEIAAAQTKADLQKLQIKYAWMGLGVSYGAGFAADEKNVSQNIYNLSQGGLTLGARIITSTTMPPLWPSVRLTRHILPRCSSSMVSLQPMLSSMHRPSSCTKPVLPLFPRAALSFVTHRPTTTR